LDLLQKCRSEPLPCIEDLAAQALVSGLFRCRALETTLPFPLLCTELVDIRILINRLGLLKREFSQLVRIDPLSHPTSRPHHIILGFIAGDDSLSISSNLLWEVVFDKGIHASVMQHQILEGIAHITCSSTISISRSKGGKG
jgi:hypothetical protein